MRINNDYASSNNIYVNKGGKVYLVMQLELFLILLTRKYTMLINNIVWTEHPQHLIRLERMHPKKYGRHGWRRQRKQAQMVFP